MASQSSFYSDHLGPSFCGQHSPYQSELFSSLMSHSQIRLTNFHQRITAWLGIQRVILLSLHFNSFCQGDRQIPQGG